MALSAIETSLITNEMRVAFNDTLPATRAVMVTAGVAGQAAKSTDVQTVVASVLLLLYGTTAPTVSP